MRNVPRVLFPAAIALALVALVALAPASRARADDYGTALAASFVGGTAGGVYMAGFVCLLAAIDPQADDCTTAAGLLLADIGILFAAPLAIERLALDEWRLGPWIAQLAALVLVSSVTIALAATDSMHDPLASIWLATGVPLTLMLAPVLAI